MAKLGKFVESGGDSQMNFTDLGSCLERIKDGLQKSVSALGKLSCEAFCFCLEELGRELKKRRQK